MTHVEVNGESATVEDVHRAAMWNYGHFTSMQVRSRAVAGLALHLRRLDEASAVLFPDAIPPAGAHVRAFIDHALADKNDASVQVTVLPNPVRRPDIDIMVSVDEPVDDAARPPMTMPVSALSQVDPDECR